MNYCGRLFCGPHMQFCLVRLMSCTTASVSCCHNLPLAFGTCFSSFRHPGLIQPCSMPCCVCQSSDLSPGFTGVFPTSVVYVPYPKQTPVLCPRSRGVGLCITFVLLSLPVQPIAKFAGSCSKLCRKHGAARPWRLAQAQRRGPASRSCWPTSPSCARSTRLSADP